MKIQEALKTAFIEYASDDIQGAHELAMGLFIGISEKLVEHSGNDCSKEIQLETLTQRNVTIHPLPAQG